MFTPHLTLAQRAKNQKIKSEQNFSHSTIYSCHKMLAVKFIAVRQKLAQLKKTINFKYSITAHSISKLHHEFRSIQFYAQTILRAKMKLKRRKKYRIIIRVINFLIYSFNLFLSLTSQVFRWIFVCKNKLYSWRNGAHIGAFYYVVAVFPHCLQSLCVHSVPSDNNNFKLDIKFIKMTNKIFIWQKMTRKTFNINCIFSHFYTIIIVLYILLFV